jgi:hypothetical protein
MGMTPFTQTNTNTLSAIGNAGNDTFVLGAGFDAMDSINGGTGTDVLSADQSTITTITTPVTNITSVEKIQVTGALVANGTINFQHFGATELELADNTAGAATLVLKTEDVVQINGNVGDAMATTDDLTLSMGSNGSSDEAVLILSGTTINGDLNATDLESLLIQTTGGPVSIEGTTALNNGAGTETLTIEGDQNISFEQGGTITADIIDAAQLTGSLSIQSGSTADSTVIGGLANDYLGFGDDVSSNINGGAGADQSPGETSGAFLFWVRNSAAQQGLLRTIWFGWKDPLTPVGARPLRVPPPQSPAQRG